MKTNTNEYRRRFAAELEQWICREDGDESAAVYIQRRFADEAGWNIARVGRQAAMAEWLQGLALCSQPYTYDDILALYERLHGEPATGKLVDRVLDGYWQHCAVQILWLIDREGK